MTLIHPEPQVHQSGLILELARGLVHPDDIVCPECGLEGETQLPVRIGRDGAFERIDYDCGGCRTMHPIWID